MRPLAPACVLILCGAILAGEPPAVRAQREPPVPKELLERVGFWAERYLKAPPEYMAKETRQDGRPGKKGIWEVRQVVMQFTARGAWQGREMVSVNGGAARTDSREETSGLLPERVSSPLELISRLAMANQERMRYFFAPDTSDVPTDEVLIGYRPEEGGRLAEVDGKSVWGTGQAWVHPDDGHIVRIEEQFEYKNTRYTTAVDFALDDVVKAWVPRQVVARIFEKGRMHAERIYTYTEFELLTAARAADTRHPVNPQTR